MSRRTILRALGATLGTACVGVAAFFLWPTQLGGWTSYAVINGSSMEPWIHDGDLVVTRQRSGYDVGDAALYHSDALDSNVYHRIVGIENGRFAFRGDNRTENDPALVSGEDILGSEWFMVPDAGSALAWLAEPVNLAIAVFVLVLLALVGGREVARRRRPGTDPLPALAQVDSERSPTRLAPSAARALLVAGAIALALFGLLGAAAWTQDELATRALVGGYAHTGTFSYEAEARRGAAYPDGVVRTGMPVFTRLSRTVDVTFDYRFTADAVANVRGGIALDAVLSDPSGWRRTLPLATEAPFAGPQAQVTGTLDLSRLRTILARYRRSTGAAITEATVLVVPRVSVFGYAGTTAIDEDFAPKLPFTLDAVSLRPSEPQPTIPSPPAGDGSAVAVSALTPRLEGVGIVTEPAALAFGSVVRLDVARARSLSVVGILAALAALGAGALLLARRTGGSEADKIESRYPSRIVRARATIPEGRWVTDVHDIESLLRLADTYDRVVLRVVEAGGGDAFLVDDGIAVYRYRPLEGVALGTPRTLAAHGR
jgi:signal peptidase